MFDHVDMTESHRLGDGNAFALTPGRAGLSDSRASGERHLLQCIAGTSSGQSKCWDKMTTCFA